MNSPAKVYFTNMRTRHRYNLLDKFDLLMKKAGIGEIDFGNKFTAIKLHFGEPGNLAFVRPNYAERVVSQIKQLGGKPFLTDCNVMYWGKRGNAVDHLQSAFQNGFNPLVTGANVIIADGLTGSEYQEVPINLKHIKNAKIGAALFHSDVIISLTHFKGHISAGFGGALKNLGMGGGSRQAKMEMHSTNKPIMDEDKCVACGACIKYCPGSAIAFNERGKAQIDYEKCVGCGQCIVSCHYGAAHGSYEGSKTDLNEKIAEYTYAVLKDKAHFHLSLIMNVTPGCDCFGYNDQAIVQDIGMAASFDPVALDRACVDLVNQSPRMPGTQLNDEYVDLADKFGHIYPNSRWQDCLDHAETIGLGTQQYDLEEFE